MRRTMLRGTSAARLATRWDVVTIGIPLVFMLLLSLSSAPTMGAGLGGGRETT